MASLRDLGLSDYEARAYRSLLNTGPTTAKELSRISDVPMGRIYDVLNTIEQYDLVRSQAASRPKKYIAVEPPTALDRLLERKKQELAAQAEQYESIVEDLNGSLQMAEPADQQFWTAAVGLEESIDLLIERFAAAEDEIVMVATTPSQQLDLDSTGEVILEALEDALERDVTVRLLLNRSLVDELSPAIGKRYKHELQQLPSFEVRTADDVSGTFHVIDGIEVCIQVPNPLEGDDIFGMIDLKDVEFATEVHDTFLPRWKEAKELTF